MTTTANTYLRVTELDFEDIRTNLKSYLSSQNQFSDYDFEGSAMAVLLDVLAYNTHYNSFYINMLANEMFLDTAQQRDSVASFAKSLGYTPISAVGASANVSLTFTGIDSSTVSQFTIPKNSTFTTTIDDIQYTYVTPEAFTVVKSGGASPTYTKNITIKEGTPVTHRFVVDANNPARYIIPNENVDTTSIVVNVQNSSVDTTKVEFSRATNVAQVLSTDSVYFLEEASDGKYEIVFGNGSLGKAVVNGNIIIVDYLVCSGEDTNGSSTFSVDSLNVQPASVSYTNVALTVNSASSGGRPQESIDSIKFNAPRHYETQNRAVNENDYSRIILTENPDLQSVVAFGGEKANPPVYGKVYIAAKPFSENFITTTRKNAIRLSILDRVPLAIDPVIIDPEYTYLIPTITTNFDATKTTETTSSIIQAVKDTITSFSTSNLERFGNRLRYSKFVRALDNISIGSIINNDAIINLEKRITPNTNSAEKITLNFSNSLRKGSLKSTQFVLNNFTCFFDDLNGIVRVYRFNVDKQKIVVNDSIGTVNYDTGQVIINNFKPTSYSGIELKISARPDTFDIIPVREQILIMQADDASVTVIGEGIGKTVATSSSQGSSY